MWPQPLVPKYRFTCRYCRLRDDNSIITFNKGPCGTFMRQMMTPRLRLWMQSLRSDGDLAVDYSDTNPHTAIVNCSVGCSPATGTDCSIRFYSACRPWSIDHRDTQGLCKCCSSGSFLPTSRLCNAAQHHNLESQKLQISDMALLLPSTENTAVFVRSLVTNDCFLYPF